MNIYELTVVIDGKTTAAKKKAMVSMVEKIIKVVGGKVTKKDDWGVKEFAYPIDKINSGNYLYFELELDADKVKDINQKLVIEEDILRFLIVKGK